MILAIINTSYWILFVWVPLLLGISPILLLLSGKKKYFYWYVTITSNLLFFIFLYLYFFISNHSGDDRFGYAFEILFVGISFVSIFSGIVIKLWWNSIRHKYIDTLFQYLLTIKRKVLLNLIKTFTLFIVLLQIFLFVSSVQAYYQARSLNLDNDKKFFYFYKPYLFEIEIDNNLRWSYTRNKYVDRNK